MRLILTVLPFILFAPLVTFANNVFLDEAENILIDSLKHAEEEDWQGAQEYAIKLEQHYPNFRVIEPLQKLLAAKQLPPQQQDAPLIKPWTNEYTAPNLLAELSRRWTFAKNKPDLNKKPASIIQLGNSTEHVIVVETNNSRGFLFKNMQGQPVYVGDFYIAIGKLAIGKDKKGKQKEGDHLTPIGVYKINSYRPDSTLQEIYGVGALTLNYPNALDKKLKKTGNGIWLHGVPRDTYSRPPNSSRGCVTMNNTTFTQLLSQINIDTTPVVITDHIQWVSKNTNNVTASLLEQWQRDWESRDSERYFSHYDISFKGAGLSQWKQHKKAINQSKKYIDIEIDNLNIYQYPQHSNIILTQFKQHYKSNNFSSIRNKAIYWKKQKDTYKIILENNL